jgi:hypothetical protein
MPRFIKKYAILVPRHGPRISRKRVSLVAESPWVSALATSGFGDHSGKNDIKLIIIWQKPYRKAIMDIFAWLSNGYPQFPRHQTQRIGYFIANTGEKDTNLEY